MANLNELVEQLQGFDVSALDWERVGVWPLGGRIFIWVAAVVVIIVGTFFGVVKDKNAQLESAERSEVTLKKDFEGKAFEAANLDKYRKQIAEMEDSFEALKKQLPDDTEVPDLVDDIDEKGTQSRLVIESVKLQPEKPAEFYIELPINIKVSGGYHEFGAFVSGIAGMPRIVTLHDFSIKRDGDKNGSNLSMDVVAKTYRYKDQE
ncbi:type 4a pilus biogenesis protein PilO [Marinagarivorans cellulosilyticus]|uniref:Type IV pilus assembly protein PilO n=1 Tax=Marinagarivorans cellulosilyticus TaxID=2721545 RepID=A0AAN1WEE0_9GAMM|nr:type 4a pilus biogenesis protein PilO [Marinagarivorans cellulosilyticus]BCD96069.1 type IV pilus assembly protein PilO [Marinagarivorans cellulosilyticus]